MKVPESVKTVLDAFPLSTLPAHALPYQDDTFNNDELIAGVYSVDGDGLPIEPRCLEAVGLLILAGKKPVIRALSPNISSANTLPLIYGINGSNKVLTKASSITKEFFPDVAEDPSYKIYRALVDTWLDNAWYDTVLQLSAHIKILIYGSTSDSPPWPFSIISDSKLTDHINDRLTNLHSGSGDDFYSLEINIERVAMSFDSLKNIISSDGSYTPGDMLVFSYTWPLLEYAPDSPLTKIIPTELREHSRRVRSFLATNFCN